MLGFEDGAGNIRGEIVTVRHNGRNEAEAARIRSKYADVTRILEVRKRPRTWGAYVRGASGQKGHLEANWGPIEAQ